MPVRQKGPKTFGFDTSKADKIFNLLLQEGQIKLSPYHTIPSVEKLKKIKYCKWHNATSHDTNECKVFHQQIQSDIEQGRLKFEVPMKPVRSMEIDQHPFLTNMVEVADKSVPQKKVLTSESAKKSGVVDPKIQVSADGVKGKGQLQDGESSEKPRRPITSQELLNKFQKQ